MKTIKPQRLGVLQRPFEASNRLSLCVTVLVAAPFDAPRSLLHEASLWKFVGAELGKDVPPDLCMPKARAELLVTGRAHPRGGAPQPACSVRVKMGPVDKTLWVVGDRSWTRTSGASDPEPFTEMPITWSRAFGGPGSPTNPVGKGLAPITVDGVTTHPLPNIEDPKRLMRSANDRPPPVGLGPCDVTSPERSAKSGTYDDKWLANQFPGLPLDFDFAFYNAAPVDQQLDTHFRGDESFSLENMHPQKPLLESRLPGVVTRVFVNRKDDQLREVPMRLETVQLFPGAERMLLIFRGVTPVTEDDASDVLQLIAAAEELGAPPRPVDHYRAVLAQRLDKKAGALASLRDTELMPAWPAAQVAMEELEDPNARAPMEFLKHARARAKLETEHAKAQEELRKAGLDPALLPPLPPYEPPKTLAPEEIEGAIGAAKQDSEKVQAAAELERAAAEADARKVFAEAGLDYDEAVAAQKNKKGGGPPKFSAAAELERISDMVTLAKNAGAIAPELEAQLADPKFRRQLHEAETSIFDMYRKHAHRLPEAPLAEAAVTERARIELPAGAVGGVSFAGRDLTGADLSGLDLRGVDLSKALLESANLAGTDLTDADLREAVLTRADLTGAKLQGAKLAGVNLGGAKLAGIRIEGGVDLTRAVLAGADLTGASFKGARMARVDLSEAIFRDTDLSGVVGEHITLQKSDLRGAKLAGASFVKCTFIEVDLRGVDLSGADLGAATLIGVKGDHAVLRGAKLAKLVVVGESSFEGVDFTGADLSRANLRGAKLAGSDFTRAEIGAADLSDCDLRGARFHRATGREARFTKADLSQASLVDANLMFALLDRAKLHGTSFLGANLFRADLAKVDVDGATLMKEANLTQIRFVQARRSRGPG